MRLLDRLGSSDVSSEVAPVSPSEGAAAAAAASSWRVEFDINDRFGL